MLQFTKIVFGAPWGRLRASTSESRFVSRALHCETFRFKSSKNVRLLMAIETFLERSTAKRPKEALRAFTRAVMRLRHLKSLKESHL